MERGGREGREGGRKRERERYEWIVLMHVVTTNTSN